MKLSASSRLIVRRFALIVLLAIGGAVFSCFVFDFPESTAYAVIQLAEYSELDSLKEIQEIQQSLRFSFTSPQVLEATISDPRARSLPMVTGQCEPAKWLATQLQVDFRDDSNLVKVSLGGSDPDSRKLLLEAWCDSYLKHSQERDEKRRAIVTKFEGKYADFEQRLQQQNKLLVGMESRIGSRAELDAARKIRVEVGAAFRKDVDALDAKIKKIESDPDSAGQVKSLIDLRNTLSEQLKEMQRSDAAIESDVARINKAKAELAKTVHEAEKVSKQIAILKEPEAILYERPMVSKQYNMRSRFSCALLIFVGVLLVGLTLTVASHRRSSSEAPTRSST